MSSSPCTVEGGDTAEELLDQLAGAGVMVNRDQRAEFIRDAIALESERCGGQADCPDSLFQELVDLVETPVVLKGKIEDRFLELPPEVIVTVMQAHQRYVPLRHPQAASDPLQLQARDDLMPEFLLVGNGLEPLQTPSSAAINASLAPDWLMLSSS